LALRESNVSAGFAGRAMGCCSSRSSGRIRGSPFYLQHPEWECARAQFTSLGFSEKELLELWRVFAGADADGSGEISLSELMAFLDLERTKFTKRVFSIFDEDMSGEIDFREFVVAMWNYCTLSKPALCLFAFDLYDADSSGAIERAEIEGMLAEVYGGAEALTDPAYTITKEVMRKLTRAEDDALAFGNAEERRNAPRTEVSAPAFACFAQKHPSVLYPAYQFQTKLQRAVCGPRFWGAKAAQRLRLTAGMRTTTTAFLKAMMNEAYYKRLLDTPFRAGGGGDGAGQPAAAAAAAAGGSGVPSEPPAAHEVAHRQRLLAGGGSVAKRRDLKGILPELGKDNKYHLEDLRRRREEEEQQQQQEEEERRRRQQQRRGSVLGAVGDALARGMRRLSNAFVPASKRGAVVPADGGAAAAAVASAAEGAAGDEGDAERKGGRRTHTRRKPKLIGVRSVQQQRLFNAVAKANAVAAVAAAPKKRKSQKSRRQRN
jgi:Ca2+-binding EF-hand superfamily protein